MSGPPEPEAAPLPRATPRPPSLAPPVPREHGTWAMLYAPLVIGLASARAGGALNAPARRGPPAEEAVLLVLAATAAFLAQATGRALPRPGSRERERHVAWCAIYAVIAMAAGLTLMVRAHHPSLAVIAVLAAAALLGDMWRHRRSRGGSKSPRAAREIIAAAVFSLAAPAGAIIARGRFDLQGWALWLFSTLFFASSVFTVRAWIDGARIAKRQEAGRSDHGGTARPGGRALLLYHIALGCFVTGAIIGRGGAGWWWAAAFLPPIARAFHVRAVALDVHPALKTVGWMELGWTVLFTATMLASMA